MEKNKIGNYFKYVIGEILLVVIGILIALSINNWNTNKQETKELQNYLKNIKNNLHADLIGIKEISVFRDSSSAYSRNYLRLARKDEISINDLIMINNSDYNVFKDEFFKPHKSGFETLKNSGYIGKLNGTKIEAKLNEYYYIIDKINEEEESLNNTVESLEIIAHSDNNKLRLIEICQDIIKVEANFNTHKKEIKNLLNHPSWKGANLRNSDTSNLHQFYTQIEKLANDLISHIDNTIKNHD